MLVSCLLIIAFDLLGEWIRRRIALPIPGPLIGLILLTVCLYVRPRLATKNFRGAARLFLAGMAMFFVPAGAGVITQIPALRAQWLSITLALSVSTIASLLVTALVMRLLDGLFAGRLAAAPVSGEID